MSQQDDDTEKEHEPTPKKLQEARKKGDIPKSNDLMTAAAYGGMLLTMVAFGVGTLTSVGEALAKLIAKSDTLAQGWFDGGAGPIAMQILLAVGIPISTWFLLPAGAVILCIIAQRAFVFAPDKLQPKLNRISLIANAKNKFGRSGLFEFGKSFVKLTIYSLVLGVFLYIELDRFVATMSFSPTSVLVVLGQLSVKFLVIVLAIALAIGFVDLLFQHQEHQRKNRMSRKELMDEVKQSEGDPHMKQQRRQRGYDIATNRMLADVPEADVVIVNPSHYAVALKWSRAAGAAPECVAKGTDEIAAKIKEIAAKEAVPIHRDPPTARALFATVEIGDEVRPEHYQAVAAAIRFAESMRAKAKARMQ